MDVRDVQERWLDAKEEYDEKEMQDLQEEAARAREQEVSQPVPQNDEEYDEELGNLRAPVPDSGVKVIRK